jgi:hypothetical protein
MVNAMDAIQDDFRCIAMKQRSVNGGKSSEPRTAAVAALLDVADPIGPHRRVMEQGRALSDRTALGKAFEGIEQDVVRE